MPTNIHRAHCAEHAEYSKVNDSSAAKQPTKKGVLRRIAALVA